MIPAPLRFFEMKEEEFGPDSTEFNETEFSIAPKAFDAVHMVLAAREFVVVMVNAPVFVATQHQAIIPEPAVGINRGLGKHLTFDDRLQLRAGAVFDHASEDLATAFEQSDDGRLPGRSAPSPPSYPPCSKVRFVNLHFARERPGFVDRQLHSPFPQQPIEPLPGVTIDPKKFARAQSWNIRAKHLQ